MEDSLNRSQQVVSDDDKEDLASSELLLSYAYEVHRRQTDIFDRLDSKAVSIAGFSGILFALVAIFTGEVFVNQNADSILRILIKIGIQVSFVLLILSLASSFGYCISVLSVRKVNETWPIKRIVEHYKTLGSIATRRRPLLKTVVMIIADSEESLRSNNFKKAFRIRTATKYLWVSLVSGVSGFVLYVINIVYLI